MHTCCVFFFFNDTATTEIYTLSLHDALPISPRGRHRNRAVRPARRLGRDGAARGARDQEPPHADSRSEEHTSELQSRLHLVCRLLLEKKKTSSPGHRGDRAAAGEARVRAQWS